MPGGGVYSYPFQELRENTIKFDIDQCFCEPFIQVHENGFETTSSDLGRFRQTFY